MFFNFIANYNGTRKMICLESQEELFRYWTDYCKQHGLPEPKADHATTCRQIIKEMTARGFVYIPYKEEYDDDAEQRARKKKTGHPIDKSLKHL